MPQSSGTPSDRLMDEFAGILSDAQDMLQRANTETGDRARDMRSQVDAKLLRGKLRLQELQGEAAQRAREAAQRAREAARATDDYVHENPWPALGVAVVGGFVIGLLMNRR